MMVKGNASVKVVFNIKIPIKQEFDPEVEGYLEAKEYISNRVHDNLRWWAQYCEDNMNSGADVIATRDFDNDDTCIEYDRELDDSFSSLDKENMRLKEEEDMKITFDCLGTAH